MFKEIFEIHKLVADRILNKIAEQNLPIEAEIGLVKDGQVKILFIYEDRELLNKIMSDSINEEFDLCPYNE